MKKFLVLFLAFGSVLTLVACGNKSDVDSSTKDVVVDDVISADDVDLEISDVVVPSEYQFNLSVSVNVEWKDQSVDMNIYKKGNKMLYEVNKFAAAGDMPFSPKKSLIIGNVMYTNLEMNWEDLWFKSEGSGMEFGDVFDLESMQKEFADAEVTKKESINGKKMVCFYKDWGKACTYKGVFAYGEWVDPDTGEKSIIKISNYKTRVKDSLFKEPTDVKTMEELSKLLMAQ